MPAAADLRARLSGSVRLRADVIRHHGDAVLCPVCGLRFDRFKDDWNRPGVICWRCGSQERHRALWLLLERRPELLAGAGSLLHFAPEWGLRRRLSRIPNLRYLTCDLTAPDVDLKLDITALALADASFDAVICSHVLEHVEDDRRAMRELCRITAPGGWCLVMVPLDLDREQTYEDPAVVLPEDRQREFLQHDHVRLYAPDIEARLQEAGFAVERVQPPAEFGAELIQRCRLLVCDDIWLCRRRTGKVGRAASG